MTIHNLAHGVMGMTSNAFYVPGDEPAIVDAGAGFDIVNRVQRLDGGIPVRLVLTHTHPDHIGNVDELIEHYGVTVHGYDSDTPYIEESLNDGESIILGDHRYEAWYTPGHAMDHLCLFGLEPRYLFSGDLIFPGGGVGRTDLPGCDGEALIDSIRSVFERTDSTLEVMYPGHGQIVDADPYRHIQAAAKQVGID